MFPLGCLFDAMNWPIFHGWGLMHGSFIVAWPLLAIFTWFVIEAMHRKK
jgi:hypothetical protein